MDYQIQQLQEEFGKYGYTSEVSRLAQNLINQGKLKEIYGLKDVTTKHISTRREAQYTNHTNTDLMFIPAPIPMFFPVESSSRRFAGYKTIDESYYGQEGELYKKILASQILPMDFFKDYEKNKDLFGLYITSGRIAEKIKTQQDFEFVIMHADDRVYDSSKPSVLEQVLDSMPYATEAKNGQFVPDGDAIFADGIGGWHRSDMCFLKALNRVHLSSQVANKNAEYLINRLPTLKDEAVLEVLKFIMAHPLPEESKYIAVLNDNITKNPHCIKHFKEIAQIDSFYYSTKHILAKWAYMYGSPELLVNNFEALKAYYPSALFDRLLEISSDEFLIDNLQVLDNIHNDQLFARIIQNDNFDNFVNYLINLHAYNKQAKAMQRASRDDCCGMYPYREPSVQAITQYVHTCCQEGLVDFDQFIKLVTQGLKENLPFILDDIDQLVIDECKNGYFGSTDFIAYVKKIRQIENNTGVYLYSSNVQKYQDFVMQQCTNGSWNLGQLDRYIKELGKLHVESFISSGKQLFARGSKLKASADELIDKQQSKLYKKRLVRLYRDVKKVAKKQTDFVSGINGGKIDVKPDYYSDYYNLSYKKYVDEPNDDLNKIL